jgi:hypothetical protein
MPSLPPNRLRWTWFPRFYHQHPKTTRRSSKHSRDHETDKIRLSYPLPFIFCSAFSASDLRLKLTNPKPLLSLVSRSRTTLARTTEPNGAKRARRSSSSASTESEVIRRVGRSSRFRNMDSPAPPPARCPLIVRRCTSKRHCDSERYAGVCRCKL